MKIDKPTPAPAPAPVGHADFATAMANIPRRQYIEFDVPLECPLEERHLVFSGERYALLQVSLKLPTVSEERRVYQRLGADIDKPMILAMAQVTEALAFVLVAPVQSSLDSEGQPIETFDPSCAVEFKCSVLDGTADGIFAAMHTAMRTLIMMGYATATQASEATASLFLKSRRSRTR